VWAHSEFVKLCYGRALGRPVDRPAATWARYRGARPRLDYAIWGPNVRLRRLTPGHDLIVALKAPATVHWGVNAWQDVRDVETSDTGLGIHVVRLSVAALTAGESVQFTFFWRDARTWEGQDYSIDVMSGR
jgi:glucoamylase